VVLKETGHVVAGRGVHVVLRVIRERERGIVRRGRWEEVRRGWCEIVVRFHIRG